jgi:diguanylate cyclase (GGDEF)-like protein
LPLVSVILLGLCLFILLFSVVVEIDTVLYSQNETAKKGKLDLTKVDMAASRPISLKGEWQFYWQQLVLSDSFDTDIDAPHDLIKVPFAWNDQVILGETIHADGFATYRLRVEIAPTNGLLALSVPVIGTAYRLYVNHELVGSGGQVSSDKESAIPDYSPQIIAISAPDGKIDIVLQVSNFHLAWGGQWFPITIASADKQFQAQLKKLIRSITIAAIFFTIAVLSLFQFALRTADILPFLLALGCICLGLREVETSHLLYITDSLSLNFNTLIRINFLTFYLAVPLVICYFHLSYPDEFRKLPVIIICAIGGLFSLGTSFTEPVVFSNFMGYFQYFALGVMAYGLFMILLAAYHRRTGARIMALGSLLLFALSANDILFSLKFINTGLYAGLGLLSFALCQTYLTYVRFINDSQEMKTLFVQANQDPLTLLLNRRGLMEAIGQNNIEQRQDSEHFSLMIIDFDHFKVLNDTLGHDAGDLVLAKGGKIMQSVVRKQDLVARWGGEEFVVMLPGTEENGAKILAEKLKEKLSKNLSEKLKHNITVSIGVAQSLEDENFSACLTRADKALYLAKENGRNKVVMAS